MAACEGHADAHCCWVGGVECPWLLKAESGDIACRLRVELGSWAAVHTDPRYVRDVQPTFDRIGDGTGACGEYPPSGERCATCGVIGG